jgi:hypothetical protein
MADAFLPLADDGATALFYNPASISSLKGMGIELMNLSLETNNDYVMGFSPTAFYKVTSLSSYAPTLSGGEYPGVGYSILPNFYARGFAFGILMQSRVAAKNENSQISYRSSTRFIPSIGTGIRLANGIFRVGYSLQLVNQAEGEISNLPSTTSPLGYNQQLNSGSGIAHQLGVNIALPVAWLPTFSVVARNVGGTKYSSSMLVPLGKNSTGVPATDPMSVDLALGLQPRVGKGQTISYVFQLKDSTNASGFSLMSRLSLGAEFALREAFSFRVGYGLGTLLDGLNAGFGFRGKKGDFHLAWYREELGTPSAPDRERRWLMQYQVRAF